MGNQLGSITKVFQNGNIASVQNGMIEEGFHTPACFAFNELPDKVILESGDSGIVLTMDKWASWEDDLLGSPGKKVHRITVSYSEELY